MPRRQQARARRRVPDAAGRAHEGARPLRRHDPARVRRPRASTYTTYAMIVEELCRGWMSLSRRAQHAPDVRLRAPDASAPTAQKERWLPAMARGEHRAALCLTEPHAGSDVQRIRTTARARRRPLRGERLQDVHHQRAHRHHLLAASSRPIPTADPPHKGMSSVRRREGPRHHGQPRHRQARLQGHRDLRGRRSRTTACRPSNLIGGEEGHGLQQVLTGLEVGRINIAARAVGVAQRRVRGRDPLRAAARDVRQADLRAPGDPAEARRHGDQDRGGRVCSYARRRPRRTAASAATSRPAWPSCSPRRPARRWRSRRCASSAATATRKEFPGRALLPRRAADDHRRGHQRDPAHGHRAAADRAE